jgi:hypothetical protein
VTSSGQGVKKQKKGGKEGKRRKDRGEEKEKEDINSMATVRMH